MKKLINICGTSRCGSTMIDLILGNDSRGFSLGEVHAWFRPFRTQHFSISCSCGQSKCPWDELKKFSEKDFFLKAFDTLDVDFLVDSSKNLSWVIDNNIYAKKNGIDVYNILLYKEPISFLYSFWKRGYSLNMVQKRGYIKYYKRCFQSGLSFIALNYNEFISDPKNVLKNLCSILGISYFDGKEEFWKKKHHHLFGSQGTRIQVEKRYSSIKSNENYKQEYREIVPDLELKIKKSNDMQKIIRDIKLLEEGKLENSISNVRIKKPYWYYLLKIKQKIQQRIPEK